MNKEELKDLLIDAQEKLFEAIEMLEDYVRETGDRNANAHLVDHLKVMASDDHEFLSRDLSIDKLIERIDEDEMDDEEDYEED